MHRGAAEATGFIGALVRATPRMTITGGLTAASDGLIGRTLGDVALERGEDHLDTLFSLAADDLDMGFLTPPLDSSDEAWAKRAEIALAEHTIVGGSDAGAHVDMMCGANYPTQFLSEMVRERGLISYERAVHQLTHVPAAWYGLRSRGLIAEGSWGDLVLFDPDTVGTQAAKLVSDLPGGASRVVAGSIGIQHVFVNGVEVVRNGALIREHEPPGKVLRRQRDTDTVVAQRRADIRMSA